MRGIPSKLTGAAMALVLCVATMVAAGAQTTNELAARGAVIAEADPLALELRKRLPNDSSRRGFDIGMAAAEGNTEPGPGKQRIHDSLPAAEQGGYDTAVSFSLQRNRNAQLAATGAAIARADAAVAQARTADSDVFYWLGFDIATGLFGDPALGATGNTLMGPGSTRIRDSLNSAAQRGFTASVALHLSRNYHHSPLQNSGVSPSTQVVPSAPANAQADRHVLLPNAATQVEPSSPGNARDRSGAELIPVPGATAQVVPYSPGNARDRLCPEFFAFRPKSPSIAAVWQPLNEEHHVFAIDAHGTLKDVWKHDNPLGTGKYAGQRRDGFWEPSISLSAPGLAPAGAPVAAVWQPLNEQLEVFTIAPNGALEVVWKAHSGRWLAPIYISAPNFAPPGAHVAALFQPLNNTLEVFAIDATGALRVVWKAQNGAWQQPVTLTPPGSAPAGAPIAAVWQPLNEQLEVFWIDTTGAMRGVLKQHNGPWQQPLTLTAAGYAGAGAEVAAVWQPLNEQLEVFTVERCGAIKDLWKAHNSAWQQPVVIYGPGDALPGAALVTLWDQPHEMLHVITVGLKGQLMEAHKRGNGHWAQGPGPGNQSYDLTKEGTAPAGAPLAGIQTNANHLEVFTLDDNQAVRVISRADERGLAGWQMETITRTNFGPIYGVHAAYCTSRFKQWSHGDVDHLGDVEECTDFMGITAYCDRQNANVSVGYPPHAEGPKLLQCTARTDSEDVIEQIVHISKGVAEGVAEGIVAAAPFVAMAAQAYACADGVLFACGTLAVEIADRAGAIPGEVQDVVGLVNATDQCANGDIVSCAKLGSAGVKAAKAAGIDTSLPAEDAAQVALMGQQCIDENFGACLRLGEKAADAAGVPIDAFNRAAKSAQDCYDGNPDACVALGEQATQAEVPLRGVEDGDGNAALCKVASRENCRLLGEALAAIPR